MTRRLLASYLLLAAFILLVVALPLGVTYTRRAEDRLLADVERDARVIGGLVEERVEAGDTAGVATVTDRYAEETKGRVVVVDASGISLADTSQNGEPRRDFSTRPEFARALSGEQSAGIRASDTLDDELAYVAVPITSGRGVQGAVRVTFSTDRLRQQVRTYWFRLGLLTVSVLGLAAGLGWLMSRWAIAPVDALEAGARQLAAGDLSGRVSIDRGPPELRALGDTLNTMAAQVEELVDSQRAFVADASHQLRTPLTALRLRLETLEDALDDGDTDTARTETDAVSNEVDRLHQLVEGLLALARAEGRRVPTTTVDVTAIARAVVDRWGALADEREVELRLVAEGPTPVLAVDGALDQVLDNLIDNALDVAPSGSELRVELTSGSDGHVVLTVRDHGPGLAAEERERATDRFWRGPASAPSGTGLGLAIVDQLVRAGGGQVELCDPATGPGLEVRIALVAAP